MPDHRSKTVGELTWSDILLNGRQSLRQVHARQKPYHSASSSCCSLSSQSTLRAGDRGAAHRQPEQRPHAGERRNRLGGRSRCREPATACGSSRTSRWPPCRPPRSCWCSRAICRSSATPAGCCRRFAPSVAMALWWLASTPVLSPGPGRPSRRQRRRRPLGGCPVLSRALPGNHHRPFVPGEPGHRLLCRRRRHPRFHADADRAVPRPCLGCRSRGRAGPHAAAGHLAAAPGRPVARDHPGTVAPRLTALMERNLDFPLAPAALASELGISVRKLERHCRHLWPVADAALSQGQAPGGAQSSVLRGADHEGRRCLRLLLPPSSPAPSRPSSARPRVAFAWRCVAGKVRR